METTIYCLQETQRSRKDIQKLNIKSRKSKNKTNRSFKHPGIAVPITYAIDSKQKQSEDMENTITHL